MNVNALDKLDFEEIDQQIFDEPEKFKVKNIEGANWALRKLRSINRKIQENNQLAEAEKFRIDSWLNKENASLEHTKQYFESLLTEHLVEARKQDPSYKISTPYGKVTARKQQPEYKRDDNIMIAWAKANDREDVVKVKEDIDWAALKENTTIKDGQVMDNQTGTIIDGVQVIERPDKVVVEVDTCE